MQTDAPQTNTTEIDLAEYHEPVAETDRADATSTPTVDAQDVNRVKVRTSSTRRKVSVKINTVRDAKREEIRRFNHAQGISD